MARNPAERNAEPLTDPEGSPGGYWGEPSPEDAQRVLPVSEWYDAEPWRITETVKPLVRYL